MHEFASFAVKTHAPDSGLHESSVHELLSLQTTGLAPMHVPFWHASVCVHAFASVHAVPFVFAGLEHPLKTSHVPASWH